MKPGHVFNNPYLFNPRVITPAVKEERPWGEFRVITIDTKKASYHGQKWRDLSGYGKRKFENLLVIKFPEERLKIIYS